jgi:Carboxypeptidase regulatory-like domain
VTGTVYQSRPTPLEGALVSAITSEGEPLGAAAQTDAKGAFQLLLPQGPPAFLLQIGPPDASSTIPTFSPSIFPQGTTSAEADVKALPPPVSVSGRVVDANATSIPGARVQAVSTDVTGWIILRQTTTDTNGRYVLGLREGNYVIEAIPDPDPAQPALSGEIPVNVNAGNAVVPDLVCPPKAEGAGTVLRPDGRAAGSGYQIVATRLPERLVTGRSGVATATNAAGEFHMMGDPGRYRLEVQPPAETSLPRTFAIVELKGTGGVEALGSVQIAPGAEVVGTVTTVTRGTQVPVPGAAVEFFALDSTGQRAVLIASALTDSTGGYRVVVADLARPAGP